MIKEKFRVAAMLTGNVAKYIKRYISYIFIKIIMHNFFLIQSPIILSYTWIFRCNITSTKSNKQFRNLLPQHKRHFLITLLSSLNITTCSYSKIALEKVNFHTFQNYIFCLRIFIYRIVLYTAFRGQKNKIKTIRLDPVLLTPKGQRPVTKFVLQL